MRLDSMMTCVRLFISYHLSHLLVCLCSLSSLVYGWSQLTTRLDNLENDVKPRLTKIEEHLKNQAEELDKKFAEVYKVVETNRKETEEKITDLDQRQKQTRSQVCSIVFSI